MDSDEVLKMIWGFKRVGNVFNDIHLLCGNITDAVIKQSMKKLSSDNVTVIFIAFSNFENCMKDEMFVYNKNTKCKFIEDEIDLSH